MTWPKLPELFPTSFPGVKTSRDDVVVDVDHERLVSRMTAYFDSNVSDEVMAQLSPGAMQKTSGFDPKATRKYLQQRGFVPQNVVRYCYRPFDVRWLYWEPETKLLDRNRADYWPHVFEENISMAATAQNRRNYEAPPAFPQLGSLHMIERGANIFPLYLRDTTAQNLFAQSEPPTHTPNLSVLATAYLSSLGAEARTLFLHALAIQHASRYRTDNADALRLDWPRIPLPSALQVLAASGALGETVAALLDVLHAVPGVTSGTIRPELRALAIISKTDGGQLDPEAGELRVTVNWGYRAKGSVMPGNGRALERPWTSEERAALEASGVTLGLDLDSVLALVGVTAFDVYLNEVAYWSGVPARVWSYTMGGYRVFKKWLSYRETDVLGRDLSPSEARDATSIVRRIAALLLLEAQLDANYAACCASTTTLSAL